MKTIKRLFRIIRINFILARYNLDEIILATHWFYPLRFLKYFNPFYWTIRKKLTRGERIRCALEKLGPIFIKAGQILSTRLDLLPEDIVEELAKLQDRVPPFPGQQAKKMIETALGGPIHHFFKNVDLKALASASIAQVHAATLLDNKEIIIKILRPNIKKIIDRDIDLLKILASLTERYWINARHLKPKQLVAEIAQTLYDELDLMREGANASQLRRNFLHSSLLYIPEIHWAYCRPSLLVMERIHGIPIHHLEALKAAKMNLKKIAESSIEIFFTQVFRDSFFHADMHPGNIFITGNPDHPTIVEVDFGITGSLTSHDQRYLAENILAFFKRQYQRVAELHIASGWLPSHTRIDQFESAIRSVCEPILEKPLKDISFGQLLLRLLQAARRFNMNIQPQLILLQKTLLNIEGLARQLDPDLDLWSVAVPHVEKWLKQQVGLKSFLRRIRENLPYWSEKLPEIPLLIYETLYLTRQQKKEENLKNNFTIPKNTRSASHKKFFLLGIGSTSILASILFTWQPVINPWLISVMSGIGFLAIMSMMVMG